MLQPKISSFSKYFLFLLIHLCCVFQLAAQSNFAVVKYGTSTYYPREIFFGDTAETYIVGQCNVRGSLNNEVSWNGYCYTPLYILGGCSPSLANTFVVGKGGLIRKNSDCEIFGSWSNQSSNTTDSLYSIKFFDNNYGVCVGQNGRILRTTDNGRQWTSIVSGSTSSLFNLSLIGDSTLFACGAAGKILKSTNRGASWTILAGGIANTLTDIDFVHPDTGYAVGRGGAMIKTVDGGLNWTVVPTGVTTTLSGLDFVSGNQGVIVGDDGVVKRTVDGGLSWINFLFSTYYDILDVKFRNPQVGYFITNQDAYKTTDGGINWYNMGGDMQRVEYLDDTTLVAVGEDVVSKSTDGGRTWKVSRPMSPSTWYGCHFLSRDTGYILGTSGRIMRTTDGGNTYTQQVTNPPTSGGSAFFAAHFFNKNKGIAIGSPYMISRTSNGGQTWTTTYSSTPGYGYYDIFFINSQVGWICGSNGTIRKTTDGGATFISQTSGTTKFLLRIYFKNANEGFVVGESGTLCKTTNGGTTWTALTITGGTLYDIGFLDSLHGYISGDSQLLMETNNGGTSWHYLNNNYTIRDMDFRSGFIGYGVGPAEAYYFFDPMKTLNGYLRACRGTMSSFKPKLVPGFTLLPGNKFILEMDTTGDDFTDALFLGAANDTSSSGYLYYTIPKTLSPGIYKMRARATAALPVQTSLVCDVTVYDDSQAELSIRNDTLFTYYDPRFNYTWRYNNSILAGVTSYYYVPTAPGIYRVDVQFGCCSYAYSTITMNACPGGLLQNPVLASNYVVICDSSAAVLSASGASAFRWYDSDTASSALAVGSSFTTPVLVERDTFYVATYNDSCESARLPIYIQFTSPAAAPTAIGDSVCVGKTAYLFTNSSSNNWYADSTTMQSFYTGSSYSLPALQQTDTFYVSQMNYQCESERIPVIAYALELPLSGVILGDTAVSRGDTAVYAYQAATGDSWQWFVRGATILQAGDSLQVQWDSTTVGAIGVIARNAAGCATDTIWLSVQVDLALGIKEVAAVDFSLHPNPVSDLLVLERRDRSKTAIYAVYDEHAKLVRHYKLPAGQSRLSIDVRNLAVGSYSIGLKSGGSKPLRFVVVH